MVTDFKYFNRIKWQYMVLDEAQAIKSSSSQRWKMLLEFKCRNRLLLSGTPIQNSMAELWSLLHFVMPTLFDSHEEFNDWFSKDIESSAENKSQIDESKLNTFWNPYRKDTEPLYHSFMYSCVSHFFPVIVTSIHRVLFKFRQIGVLTRDSFSSWVLKVCNLGRVEARYWKPKIVFSQSTNTSPVWTHSNF